MGIDRERVRGERREQERAGEGGNRVRRRARGLRG